MIETNLAILIGIGLFFVSLISMVVYILYKRFLTKTISAGFISEGMNIERKRYYKKDIKATINYNGGSYIYNSLYEMETFRGREIYYFLNDPNPVRFNFTNRTIEKINSENLKAIIETELIAKLFKKEIFNTENILLIIIIICSLASLGLLIKMFATGVKISQSPETAEYIKGLVVEALKKGV